MSRVKEFFGSIVSRIKNMSRKGKIICLVSAILLVSAVTVGVVLLCRDKTDNPPASDWTEAGVYYYDADNVSCELTLVAGGSFTLKFNDESETGTYSLTDTLLVLDFYKDSKENIEATYDNRVVTLTYGGLTMRMIEKVSYTVKFETGEGSEVSDVSVINGKTVQKPSDPTREGFLFVGWYKDAEYKTPFTFSSDIVISDVTLYARWVEKQDKNREYTVTFDLGYDGATAPLSRTTVGARLFDVADPDQRAG